MTYKRRALKGDSKGAHFLSICFETGFGVTAINRKEMITWAVKTADLGSFDAVNDIASKYSLTDLKDDIGTFFRSLLKAAETGHKASIRLVSSCYRHGIGVERDDMKYWEWDKRYNSSLSKDTVKNKLQHPFIVDAPQNININYGEKVIPKPQLKGTE